MVEKAIVGVIAGLGLVIMGMIAWVIWTMFAPYNLFDAPAIWPVSQNIVHPGEDVISDLKFCKSTDLPAEIGRMTIGKDLNGNEYLFIHPTVSGSFPAGCFYKHVSVATIPPNTRPGKYKVSIAIRYQYSAFRVVQHHFMTQEFDVVP